MCNRYLRDAGRSGRCAKRATQNYENLRHDMHQLYAKNLHKQLTGPSVTRFTHRSCNGVSGSGKPNKVAKKMVAISPKLQEIKKQMKDCMLL